MRPTLTEFLGSVLDAPITKLRNYAIGVAVCAAGAIGAVYYALAAAVLALETPVGPVYARLIVAVAFAVIAFCAIMVPRLSRSESITRTGGIDTSPRYIKSGCLDKLVITENDRTFSPKR